MVTRTATIAGSELHARPAKVQLKYTSPRALELGERLTSTEIEPSTTKVPEPS